MTAILIAVVLLGLLLAGLLSAGEAAVLRITRASLTEARADAQRGSGPKASARAERALAAQRLVEDPAATVAALSIVRVAAELLAVGAIALLLGKVLNYRWEVLIALAGIGLVGGLLMARSSPRQLGLRQPLRVLLALAGLLTAVRSVTGWATRGQRRQAEAAGEDDTDRLRELADRVEESDLLEDDDVELVRSVFELGGTLTREVMVPRTDIVAVEDDASLATLMRLYVRSGFSRVPVIGDTVEDVLGIAYFKDVARILDADPAAGQARAARDAMRPVVYVPESKPIDDLLRFLQGSETHIAIVVDEYGGVAGLVTIEDILEELVGELVDEHDHDNAADAEPEQVEPGVFRVPARLPVDELGDLFDLRFDDDEVDTAGGLLAKALGRVPLVGSSAEVGGLRLTAETIQGRRKQVATILVSTSKEIHG